MTVMILVMGLGIGMFLAGLLLVIATSVYAKRIRSPELIRAMGLSIALAGLVVIVIALG